MATMRSPAFSPARAAGLPGNGLVDQRRAEVGLQAQLPHEIALPVRATRPRDSASGACASSSRRRARSVELDRGPRRTRRAAASAGPASSRTATPSTAVTRSPLAKPAAAAAVPAGGVATIALGPARRRRKAGDTAAPRAAGWRSARRRRSRSAARPTARLKARGRSFGRDLPFALVDHLHVPAERHRGHHPLGAVGR